MRARIDTGHRRGLLSSITNSPSSKAFPSSRICVRSQYPACAREGSSSQGTRTSPHPLHGYAMSSPSMGDSICSVGVSILGGVAGLASQPSAGWPRRGYLAQERCSLFRTGGRRRLLRCRCRRRLLLLPPLSRYPQRGGREGQNMNCTGCRWSPIGNRGGCWSCGGTTLEGRETHGTQGHAASRRSRGGWI